MNRMNIMNIMNIMNRMNRMARFDVHTERNLKIKLIKNIENYIYIKMKIKM